MSEKNEPFVCSDFEMNDGSVRKGCGQEITRKDLDGTGNKTYDAEPYTQNFGPTTRLNLSRKRASCYSFT